MVNKVKEKIKKLPDSPGIYFFKKGRKILYIGKATSLRDRVRSYFSGNIGDTRGPLIQKMLGDFTGIAYQKTDSVLEALVLEAALIKKHQPEANIKDKDNRSFNYVVITKEDFPRVLVMRQRELEQMKAAETDSSAALVPTVYAELPAAITATESVFSAFSSTFGPFTNGSQLREAMKIVRRLFPFRGNKCEPGQGRACFERQLGLCPGVCTGEISKENYAKQIKNIVLFFEGNKTKLVKNLQKEMKEFAKQREFEKAARVKRQLYAIYHIQDISLIKAEPLVRINPISDAKIQYRIESYDIAHLSGTNRVGVMTVVEGGEIKKADYRKFKIRSKEGGDTGALKEMLSRRLNHNEWPTPNLIVVDGGIAQKNAMEKVLTERSLKIPVVSVVKDEHHKPKEILGLNPESRIQNPDKKERNKQLEKEILIANAEAHRFAISFHRYRRRKLW